MKYMDEYMQCIYKKCENRVPSLGKFRKLRKLQTTDVIIPTIHNFDILTQYQYNREQLKLFVKHYKLKQSGNKNELFERIYCYLYLSKIIIKIQKVYRGVFQRTFNKCHGPALMNRALCTNNTDFFTMDDLASLPNNPACFINNCLSEESYEPINCNSSYIFFAIVCRSAPPFIGLNIPSLKIVKVSPLIDILFLSLILL